MRLSGVRAVSVALLAAGLLVAVVAATPGLAGATATDGLRALTPARVLNTRDGTGAPVGPVGARQTLTFQVAGVGGVPASGVGAVAVTITAADPSAASWLTVWPAGQTRPNASNVNFAAQQTVANYAIVKLSDTGELSLFNQSGSVDVLVDVSGWFPAGSGYVPATPTRLVDMRNGTGG